MCMCVRVLSATTLPISDSRHVKWKGSLTTARNKHSGFCVKLVRRQVAVVVLRVSLVTVGELIQVRGLETIEEYNIPTAIDVYDEIQYLPFHSKTG